MAYQGYPGGGGGYPPQQPGGYPGQQPGYPPQPAAGGAYPPQQGGAYPPQGGGGYPPASGGYGQPPAPGGGYGQPPAPGGYGAPPTTQGYPPAQGGYPPAGGGQPGYPPQAAPGGYPGQPAPGGYPGAGGPHAQGGLGFESVQQQGHPPAPGYGQPPAPVGGYGQPPAQTYGQPPGGYGAPPQQPGYPATTAPPAGYPGSAPAVYNPPGGAAPYGAASAPPQSVGYYPSAPTNVTNVNYGLGPPAVGLAGGMAAMSITQKTHGTVKTHSPFHAEEDAKILRKAMKGMGTDEKAIINIIAFRTNKQRQEILTSFKQMYGKDLIKELKSELSSNFEELVVAMMMKPTHYDAYCLEKAMSGIGTKENVLIEILTSRSNKEIQEIKEVYKTKYRRNLEKEVMSETSGHFKRLLVSLVNASRNESPHVDPAKARQDAQALYSAGEKKWGTDESTFNLIMCSRSLPQLRATFDEYKKIAGCDIYKSIQKEFSGDIEDGMLAVVEVARYAPSYFATLIYKSMKGAGTHDTTLIRCVVSRSEVDMVEIKQEFQRRYHKTLSSFIQGDTSGDYKKLLMAIVGN